MVMKMGYNRGCCWDCQGDADKKQIITFFSLHIKHCHSGIL